MRESPGVSHIEAQKHLKAGLQAAQVQLHDCCGRESGSLLAGPRRRRRRAHPPAEAVVVNAGLELLRLFRKVLRAKLQRVARGQRLCSRQWQ